MNSPGVLLAAFFPPVLTLSYLQALASPLLETLGLAAGAMLVAARGDALVDIHAGADVANDTAHGGVSFLFLGMTRCRDEKSSFHRLHH